jgi:hypothetical protein
MTEVGRRLFLRFHIPGRLRARLPWLEDDPAAATALADGLARLDGMIEVRVRPRTGSVLCLYDPERLGGEPLLEQVRSLSGASRVVRPGEPAGDGEEEQSAARSALHTGTELARAAAKLVKSIDADVLTATSGQLGLADFVAGSFLVASAVEVATAPELPLPSWYDLVWWAVRTFTLFDREAIQSTRNPLEEVH